MFAINIESKKKKTRKYIFKKKLVFLLFTVSVPTNIKK